MTDAELAELVEEVCESSPLAGPHLHDELLDEGGRPRPAPAHGGLPGHRRRDDDTAPVGRVLLTLGQAERHERVDRPGRCRVGGREGICQRTEP